MKKFAFLFDRFRAEYNRLGEITTQGKLLWVVDVETDLIIWSHQFGSIGTESPLMNPADGDFITEAKDFEELKGLYMEYFL